MNVIHIHTNVSQVAQSSTNLLESDLFNSKVILKILKEKNVNY